jgi:hypothetical protein
LTNPVLLGIMKETSSKAKIFYTLHVISYVCKNKMIVEERIYEADMKKSVNLIVMPI